jgi:magnesium-transporting ATPase (P-type)
MISRATRNFWKGYQSLPIEIQKIAIRRYRLWLSDPQSPTFKLKMRNQIFYRYFLTPILGAFGLAIASACLWFYQLTELEKIRQDMGFADRERSFIFEHLFLIGIPFSLVFWFVIFFILNWLVRLIMYSIKKMESNSNNTVEASAVNGDDSR